MKFKYTALGADNQKLEGVLEAGSLDAAKNELHKMGLSIIAIAEISADEFEAAASKRAEAIGEGIVTFLFKALDSQKKEVNGTIDSKQPYLAFKRLVTEYHFDVQDLYPESSQSPEVDSSRSQFEQWKRMLEEEGFDLSKKPEQGVRNELEEEEEMMSQEIVDEIDHFIINTKKILEQHTDQYSEPQLREIDKTLNDLERIRASNNLKHITKVCNTLYELIAHPDATPPASTDQTQVQPQDQEYSNIVSSLKDSGFVSHQLQFLQAHKLKKKAARFDKVQHIFGKIMGKLNQKRGAELAKGLAGKRRTRQSKLLEQLSGHLGKKSEMEKDSHITFKDLTLKFFEYIKAPNNILRRARKQEFIVSYHEWKAHRAKVRMENKQAKEVTPTETKEAKDFSDFFLELDSFIGWLLFFYLAYFYLAFYSLERNIGLPKELVLKTFASPLLVNLAILLILLHLSFTIKIKFLRQQFLSSLFLFFFTISLYSILMVNF
ncbi:MAG: hypothetical protein OEY44_02725 [Candidatus Peregrinibacteria bacterium]|nr:hypothetical protein [Candidatus Peregrinibacteria bacterium]